MSVNSLSICSLTSTGNRSKVSKGPAATAFDERKCNFVRCEIGDLAIYYKDSVLGLSSNAPQRRTNRNAQSVPET